MKDLFAHFRAVVIAEIGELAKDGELPTGLDLARVAVEPPRDPTHGDISANAAMVLAKTAGMQPRILAEKLAARLRAEADIVAAEVAGPGFINLRIADSFWHTRLADILLAGASYGNSEIGTRKRVNVEYVSANPTGPMHVGHGRGAVVGDALAALLEKVGFQVCREYYINDAGAQIDVLASSVGWRYLQALGVSIGDDVLAGFYPGDYLIPVGEELFQLHGDKFAEKDQAGQYGLKALDEWFPYFRSLAIERMMVLIRSDLKALGVEHEVITSEREIVAAGGIEKAIAALDKLGLIYTGTLEPPRGKLPDDWEPRPQLLFRSTKFGDDVDRPLKKSDGTWTYFAADIAYHFDKVQRGFDDMIDIWGADHGGYVKRMQAAVTALTQGKAALDVKLCQLVNLFDQGQPVRMSKRAGTFVTLREVVDQVGKDVFRFVMLTRRNDQALDFDFAKVVEQSKDNPVFYVQYAHARASSVMRHARDEFATVELEPDTLAKTKLSLLDDRDEIALIRLLAQWPRIVEGAAETHEPHRIAFYLQEVAAAFHALWNKGKDEARLRFLQSGAKDLTLARLALVQAVAFVIASGLQVFGVTPAEEMRG